jgi:hypothetical protein
VESFGTGAKENVTPIYARKWSVPFLARAITVESNSTHGRRQLTFFHKSFAPGEQLTVLVGVLIITTPTEVETVVKQGSQCVGGSGIAATEVCIPNSGALAAQPNGGIIVVGGCAVCFEPNGTLDPSLGVGGVARLVSSEGGAVALQSDGKFPRRWLRWRGRRDPFAL